MKQYVTYKRVSTKDQGNSGQGLAAQDRDIGLFLQTYSPEPFEVVAEFVDIQSGNDADRPELTKALDMVRQNGAELLVSKIDRLSRKVSFIAGLMDDKNVQLRVASMPSADKFQIHIYAALAEQEREFISIRTKAALEEAKLRGVKLGGLRDKTNERNKVIQRNAKDRADRVSGIVLPLREQGQSFGAIAEVLNQSGVATARGGKWHPSQVKRVVERLAD